jgi:hypothetical protein
MFRRKNKWEKLSGRVVSEVAKKPALKTGAVAAGGIAAATVASAAISSFRRRNQ